MKLLIIEDNEDIIENLFEYFELKSHILDVARDGLSGLHFAATQDYDGIILDLMLPGLDGLEICRKLRQEARSPVPIIILTARDTLENKLTGFAMGADDYLVKPFALPELEARLLALHRRVSGEVGRAVLKVGDLEFNRETLEVTRAGSTIELNHITRSILKVLMAESPKVVTRERLEREIWGDDPPTTDALRTHMYNLRNAIDRPFPTALLRTVPREGYRLVAEDGNG
ncbi:MAG: response regulator transcription factor [Bdellovibrionales bacterium]|nr:response regulator transcription factor [Bdellovibrionales bacterium]